jgi:heme A synthase
LGILYFSTLQLIYGAGDVSPVLDSQFRYLSGIYFAVGIGMLIVVWRVERAWLLFAVLILAAFLGGIGRLVSLSEMGLPNAKQHIGMYLELATPLLLVWMWHLRRKSRQNPGRADT